LPLAKSRDKEKKGNKKKRELPPVKRKETKRRGTTVPLGITITTTVP
jgi:hypothetical protein